jgi:adenylate cyclase
VGEVTEQRTRTAFAFQPVASLALKGREQSVAASVLIGPRSEARDAAEPVAADSLRRAPLVGRAAELGTLARCLEDLRRGRGQVATILGEPGLGKSRLLAELRASAEGVRWARCQAFAHERGLGYGLTRDLVRELCELDADESDAAATRRLRAHLEALGTPGEYPLLAHLLTLPLDPVDRRRIEGLPPQ